MLWLKENWFKVSLILVVPVTALVLIYGIVIYPESIRQQERLAAEANERREALDAERKAEEEKIAAEERVEKLQSCLDESEYEESTSHLAMCGDPNVGRSPRICQSLFGGTTSFAEVVENYETEFPSKLPPLPSLWSSTTTREEHERVFAERQALVDEYWDKCNCGLEKVRRDELKADREYRDKQCNQLYGAT